MEDVNALSELPAPSTAAPTRAARATRPTASAAGWGVLRRLPDRLPHVHDDREPHQRLDESITFYLDGNQYFSVSESQVGTSTWQAAFDHSMSIIFDLAMGGAYPNGVCNCTSPSSSTTSGGTMSVAYVAAYTTSGGGGGGGGGGAGTTGAAGRSPATGPVRRRPRREPGELHPGPGLHLQRHQRSAVDGGPGRQHPARPRQLPGYQRRRHRRRDHVDLYTCNNTAAQVFIPESNEELYNPQSNKCLDDTGYGGPRHPAPDLGLRRIPPTSSGTFPDREVPASLAD